MRWTRPVTHIKIKFTKNTENVRGRDHLENLNIDG
jgi:hypothetical protein